jgi:hypothetical protein
MTAVQYFGENLYCVPANLPEYRAMPDEVAVIALSSGVDKIIMGGDFNADTRRNSQDIGCLNGFLELENLVNGLTLPTSIVPFTFESKINGHKSILDHFIFSENLLPKVD